MLIHHTGDNPAAMAFANYARSKRKQKDRDAAITVGVSATLIAASCGLDAGAVGSLGGAVAPPAVSWLAGLGLEWLPTVVADQAAHRMAGTLAGKSKRLALGKEWVVYAAAQRTVAPSVTGWTKESLRLVLRQLLGARSTDPQATCPPAPNLDLHRTVNLRIVYERCKRNDEWRSPSSMTAFDHYLASYGPLPSIYLSHLPGTPFYPVGNALAGLVATLPMRRTPTEIWNWSLPEI
jgi:hypothetical protein